MKVFAVPAAASAVKEMSFPTPNLVGDEVLVKVRFSGVCHTDTHLQEGGYHLGSRGFLAMEDRGVNFPMVLGHEIVGEVVKTGPKVSGAKKGDLRLVYPWIGCGDCRACLDVGENYCSEGDAIGVHRYGGYADMVVVPHEKYLVNIDGLDPQWAATLACSGLTSFAAVNKLPAPAQGDPIAVIGTGGVGLTAIAVLSALGYPEIVAVDLSDERLEVARNLGATVTVNSSKDLTPLELVAATGSAPVGIIDFVNNGRTSELGFDAMRKGGTYIGVGMFGGEMRIPTVLLAIKSARIIGNYVGNLDELHRLVAIAKEGGLPSLPIFSGALTAEGINDALERVSTGMVDGRIVLEA